MRTLALFCAFILVAASALSQQKLEDKAMWLFPADKDLLSAGEIGFHGNDDIPLQPVYKRAGASLTLAERMTNCRDKVELVQVAGPRTLAALRGHVAQKQGAAAPNENWVLESRGEILLSVEFYASKEHEEAQASLWQENVEYRPIWQHVIRERSIGCDFHALPGGRDVGLNQQNRHIIQEWYIVRFMPEGAGPDWEKSFRFPIRRADGQIEEYEIMLGTALEKQAKESW
jgi:hypothetical protein